uniref:Reverse transcriptase domain-containing protein n=1 Tax=Tanacetum cinerariifolium TaxID=118510 RepID=A0A699IMB7_TANCI|nr:hypothetical protein [Tanacetum cinerariifolium]
MARTESSRMIIKDIKNMTIAEYMKYEVEMNIRSWGTSEAQGVSFVTKAEEWDSSETLPCQLPPKEINPESFTLPCTIGNLKLYAMADLEASVNVKPKSLFKHLKVANLIDMLEGPNEIMLLGKPFLATIHAKIDVFRREILLGIGKEKVKFDMNGGICHSRVPFEKNYMASFIQESKYFNTFEIENDVFSYDFLSCLLFNQTIHHYSNESINTIDSSDDMQELEGSQQDEKGNHLLENVSRWHVCKPVCVTVKDYEKDCEKWPCVTVKDYEKDCGKWPTCNTDISFCSGNDAVYGKEESGMLKQWICFRDHERQNVKGNGMIFVDILKVRYGNKNIDDVTPERRYYEWVAQNYDFNIKSRKTTKYVNPYDFHHEYHHPYIPQESDSPPDDIK